MSKSDTPKGEGTFIDLSEDEAAPEPTVAAVSAADADEERLHPILSNEEVRAAQAKARAALDKERRAAAMKAVEDTEKQRLRNEEGMVTGDGAKDEMVEVTIDLAEHSNRIVLNSHPYWNGHTYTVPRHVADTLREIMTRGWKHQDEADGRDLSQQFQSRRQVQMLRKGAPGGAMMSAKTGAVRGAPKDFAAEELRA